MSRQTKILVISLAGIGDTLLATPLVRELRENCPEARIDVLVMWSGARDLLEGNPAVDRVHFLNMIKAGPLPSLRFLWGLRRENYDISLNTYPQSKIQYRMVAWLIRARERVSHRYENARWLDGWLINRSVAQDYQRHSVENNLALLEPLGLRPRRPQHEPELFLKPEELAWASQFLRQAPLLKKRILGLHVGSGKTKNLELRRWPLGNYIELIQRLLDAIPDLAVILFGGPEEQEDHATLLRAVHHPSALVATSRNLREAAALLQKCDLFLSVDTALMHLAAAMKVPAQFVIETPTFNKTIEPHARPYVLIPNSKVQGKSLDYYRYDGRGIRGTAEELAACMGAVTVDQVFQELQIALPATARSS